MAIIPLLCSGIGAKALADTSLDVENYVLDPVTVIATHTERPLAELPASIGVLDSEQIMGREAGRNFKVALTYQF